ncbi:MAG: hypothetical protein F4139_08370 [Gemmatimonadetes bacterium]|nr:hypothetical protein [Gemmatimonadota bacterium]MYA65216.1 hypothetical protein [Gemmatimonadota bacterium]MYB99556.1 hypothetical protein [Gemmatimonadota bacterium]MYH52952.1 hypothetical protein [Gemmatimonadota bacterium]MYK67405.1 hypothetical protein [Gemmatimonadota bacterium]
MPEATTRNGLILAMHDPHLLPTVTAEVRDAEGRLLSSLGSHSGQEMALVTATMVDAILFSVRLPRTTWDHLFVIGPTDRYELKAFTGDGRLARIVRRGHEPRAVTRAHIDAHVAEILSPPYPDDWTESQIESYLAEGRQRYRVAPRSPQSWSTRSTTSGSGNTTSPGRKGRPRSRPSSTRKGTCWDWSKHLRSF